MAIGRAERDALGLVRGDSRRTVELGARSVGIRYRSERGYRTTRTIRPLCYSRAADGREFIRAWCELRQAERTFRVDRIEQVFASGELSGVVSSVGGPGRPGRVLLQRPIESIFSVRRSDRLLPLGSRTTDQDEPQSRHLRGARLDDAPIGVCRSSRHG